MSLRKWNNKVLAALHEREDAGLKPPQQQQIPAPTFSSCPAIVKENGRWKYRYREIQSASKVQLYLQQTHTGWILYFGRNQPKQHASPETWRNRPKSHPRWNRGARRSILLAGTISSSFSLWLLTASYGPLVGCLMPLFIARDVSIEWTNKQLCNPHIAKIWSFWR